MSDEYIHTVMVQYKHRDGWHVFSSNDVPGLYVASKDPVKAYDDVPVALKQIMELDYACQWEVRRAPSFVEFRERLLKSRSNDDNEPQLQTESFVVMGRRCDRPAHTY
jgi:hypothetical protein